MRTLDRVAVQSTSSSNAILEAAEEVGQLSDSELRQRIDQIHSVLVNRFLSQAHADEEASELSRLIEKLEALRERLLYSYFGESQLRSLQEVFYDLHAAIERHVANGRDVPVPH